MPPSTTRSVLLHAALAHFSDDVQTLDAVISQRSTWTDTRLLTLPTEVLLLIRDQLFPLVTTDLIAESAAALRDYEWTLRSLLCAECTLYHFDIYGPDLWQWEQFNGACACGPYIQPFRMLNPKEFCNASEWLEARLSAKLANQRNGKTNIWHAVIDLVRTFGCEILDDTGRAQSRLAHPRGTNNHHKLTSAKGCHALGRGLSDLQRDDHLHIQQKDEIQSHTSSQQLCQPQPYPHHWRVERLRRDLSLACAYPEIFSTDHLPAITGALEQLASNSSPSSPSSSAGLVAQTHGIPLPSEFLLRQFKHALASIHLTRSVGTFLCGLSLLSLYTVLICCYARPRAMSAV